MDDEEFNEILRKAQVALNSGNWPEAIRLLELIKEALSPVGKNNLAVAYGNLGQYSKVVELLEPIKDNLPPEGKSNLAAAYGNLGQDSKVVELLEPDRATLTPEGKTNLTTAYGNLGQYSKVVELLEPDQDRLPPDGKSNLAAAYNNLGQYNKTLALLALDQATLPPEAKSNLAVAYINLGQANKAVELLEGDKDRLPPEAKSNLAAAYINLGQDSRAVELLEGDKDRLKSDGKSNLAAAYGNLGQDSKVVELLEPVKDKLSPIGKTNLALAYILSEQFSPAINFVKQTNNSVVTAMFITDLLTYFKNTLLNTGHLPFTKENSALKKEIVSLFFNTYLNSKLGEKLLDNEQASLFNQICVLALLKLDDELTVSYYCSTKTYEAMFDKSAKNKFELQMSVVEEFNDPQEGKMLSNNDVKAIDEGRVFIKCFSLRTNNLTQFRLYGGEKGQADGASLVFEPSFFSRVLTSSGSLAEAQKLPLFRVCYLEPRARPHYKIHGLATPDITSYLANNPGKKRKHYQKEVLKADTKLINHLELLLANMGEIYIPFLPYLFKDKAFLDEAECRIIYIDPAEELSFEPDAKGRRVYMRYNVPLVNHLKEVIFGPNNEETLFLSTYLRLPFPYKKIPWQKSALPYK